MKILMIINSLHVGGAEKLLVSILPHFNKKGIKVDLLLLNGHNNAFYNALSQSKSCVIFTLGAKNSIYNPFNIFKLIGYIKKYDIVHAHLFPTFYYVALAKLFMSDKPKLVCTEHSTYNKRMENRIAILIDNLIYSCYHKVICITELVKQKLENTLNIQPEKLEVINNGIDLEHFTHSEAIDPKVFNKNHRDSSKYLIQVSNFKYPKDQKTVIRALSFLPENVNLVLVGEGEALKACKAYCKEINVSDRVHFLLARTDISQLLKMADIIILSSAYEGLSLSCLEGLASGRPFIGSNVPGIRDVISGAGILFEKGNYMDLLKAIESLINDEKFYKKVVEDCLNRSKQFGLDKMLNKHISLYEELHKSTIGN